jgi:hypothetical protein
MKPMAKLLTACTLVLMAGCSTYTTPGAGVRIEDLPTADLPSANRSSGSLSSEELDFAQSLKAQPTASFPARVAIARIQVAGYSSASNTCYGEGRLCVVITRDIETDESYDKLSKLPSMAGLAAMNRLVLPRKFTNTKDLRQAAAILRADMLLVYTLDTAFKIENTFIGPLALISLGLLPNKKARVTTTASAAMFDVRTGFIYGLAEATAIEEQRATFWSTSDAIDSARKTAESAAFEKLVGEIAKFWGDVLKTHRRDSKLTSTN